MILICSIVYYVIDGLIILSVLSGPLPLSPSPNREWGRRDWEFCLLRIQWGTNKTLITLAKCQNVKGFTLRKLLPTLKALTHPSQFVQYVKRKTLFYCFIADCGSLCGTSGQPLWPLSVLCHIPLLPSRVSANEVPFWGPSIWWVNSHTCGSIMVML